MEQVPKCPRCGVEVQPHWDTCEACGYSHHDDPDPVSAVRDALRGREVDEIIVSTLPRGLSRWLGEDVPSRLRDSVRVPVTVVTQTDAGTA